MKQVEQAIFRVVILLLVIGFLPRLAPASDEWLPVPPEDLALKDNPKQPGADAMVLYREVNEDAKESTVDNYVRIKIFTQAGVKSQADVELPYDKAQESLHSVRARTIRPDGSVVNFDGKMFDKEIVKGGGIKYLATTFTMPSVEPGSIIEYKYREQMDKNYYHNLVWVVQEDIFTRLARFSIKPDDSSYALPLKWRPYGLQAPPAIQKQGSVYTLELHDLPGIEQEPLMPPRAALEARIEFYYKDRGEPDTETAEQYWKRIGKMWSDENDHFVDKRKELTAEVSQDIGPNDPPETKLRKLYARTLKIRNLDLEDEKTRKEEKQEHIKPNNNVEDVLKHGYGRSWEINMLLLGLTRAAGFQGTEIRVVPRSGMYFYPQRQASRDLSAQLVWVRAGSKEYFLDPAAHYYAFGVLPWYETAANGFRVSKDGSEQIFTPPPVATDATIVRHADLTLGTDMQTFGKFQVDFTGQEAATRRYDNRDEDDAGRKKALEDEVKGWLPLGSTVEITNITGWDDMEQPIHIEGTLHIPSFGSGASLRRMLMPVMLFQSGEVGYFHAQKRVNEVDFWYPYEKTDDIVLHAPPGYTAPSLPAPQKMNPGPISYEISAVSQPNGLEVKRLLVIREIRYPKESYLALRSFFNQTKSYDDVQVLFQYVPPAKGN